MDSAGYHFRRLFTFQSVSRDLEKLHSAGNPILMELDDF